MARYFPYRERTERTIALGRAVLVLFSLIAVLLEGTQSANHADLVSILMGGYLVYAAALGVLAWQVRRPIRGARIATHVVDLVFFLVIVYLTRGATSLFFVFFVFFLAVANIRWALPGTVGTAAGLLLGVLAIGFIGSRVSNDPALGLNRFIVGMVYLGIITVLLVQFNRYEETMRQGLERLAGWRHAPSDDMEALIRAALPEAANVLGARRALLIWDETEEPSRFVAYAGKGEVRLSRHSPDAWGDMVPPVLDGESFISLSRPPSVAFLKNGKILSQRGDGMEAELRSAFSVTDFVSVPLEGKDISGRLFFLEHPIAVTDCLFTAEIIGTELLARMEGVRLLADSRRAAALEERMQRAADLHDGVLQSLTAVGLELATISLSLPKELEETGGRLSRLAKLISTEQRDLRVFIDELRRGQPAPGFDLAVWLVRLEEEIEQHWRLEVTVRADRDGLA